MRAIHLEMNSFFWLCNFSKMKILVCKEKEKETNTHVESM